MLALLQVLLSGLITGSLYGLLALGIVLIYRTTGVLNFAYGALAATTTCFLYVLLTGPRLPFWPALLLSLLFALGLGAVVERGFARPLLAAPILAKAIATLALALVLQTLIQALWPQLTTPVHFPTPFEGHALRLGGLYLSLTDGLILITTLALLFLLQLFLQRTRLGMALRATADGLEAARLMGIPVGLVFLLVWMLTSLLAAIAGILIATRQTVIDVQFMDPVLLLAFIGAVLGGLERLEGAVLGGLLVGLADNLLALLLAGRSLGALDLGNPGIRQALIFAGFILLLLLRPRGLFGEAALRRV
ncbi:branched-chain amino acid ABC transporter permease [Thermogemmatispora sp.]|uniref:branched-chain amino acid ABC transporter permease n=1 Tax=Thermogemmatispora sp. TaxID=1968838 RepID=UPI0035E411BB